MINSSALYKHHYNVINIIIESCFRFLRGIEEGLGNIYSVWAEGLRKLDLKILREIYLKNFMIFL